MIRIMKELWSWVCAAMVGFSMLKKVIKLYTSHRHIFIMMLLQYIIHTLRNSVILISCLCCVWYRGLPTVPHMSAHVLLSYSEWLLVCTYMYDTCI